jgi:tripartite-type tricarboxylate transporter receptor subunit TctC
MKKVLGLAVMTLIAILCIASFPVGAADFPTKPITAIVTVSPGGSNDIQTRAFASVAEKILKQPVVVINKPAASGMLGLLQGAEAAPDGYTLTTSSMSEMCVLEWEKANNRKTEVALEDFVSIGGFTVASLIIGVPVNSPWKTIDDLIKDAKGKPGEYAFASGGLYRIQHVNTELFAQAFGLKFRHVPYGGGGQAVTAVVGGHEHFASMTPSSSIPLFKGNKIRPLAVQGDKRLKSLPNVPTLKEATGIEAGMPQIVGLGVPKKTPAPVVERLRAVVKQVTEDPAFINVIESQGDEVHHVSGEEFAKISAQETQKVAKLFKQLLLDEKKK